MSGSCRARKGLRYLTLTHLKNACIDDLSMKVFRQGAIKLINSLSRSSDVVRLTPIDPDETIIRVNLDELGWNSKDWDERAEILSVQPAAGHELQDRLVSSTDSKCRMCAPTGSPSRPRSRRSTTSC